MERKRIRRRKGGANEGLLLPHTKGGSLAPRCFVAPMAADAPMKSSWATKEPIVRFWRPVYPRTKTYVGRWFRADVLRRKAYVSWYGQKIACLAPILVGFQIKLDLAMESQEAAILLIE